MIRGHYSVTSNSRRAILSFAALLILVLIGLPGIAQEVEVTLEPAREDYGGDPLAQVFAAADGMFNEGLLNLDEDLLRRAAAQYEYITREFPLDLRHLDAFFSAAYIYMEYLQSPSDYEQAYDLLSQLIMSNPYEYNALADGYLTRAHLEYRCTREYRAAQEDLSELLNNLSLSSQLGHDGVIDVQVLLAKCRQKLGEYDEARRLWEEITFSNPELDTEGRLHWIMSSGDWFRIDSGGLRLFFENGVDQDTYTLCLTEMQRSLAAAASKWGLHSAGPVDVYLYNSSDHLFDYTLRSEGFVLPNDAEVHLAPADIRESDHLAGWVVAHRLNTRPDVTVLPFLRAGFNHYFLGSRSTLDELAAKEIYYYGGTITDQDLLFPLSYDYTFSNEYKNIAASFIHYLVDGGHINVQDLRRFYRLLWARPDRSWQPPLVTELLRGSIEGETLSWQQGLIMPVQVHELFEANLGVGLSDELAAWQETLTDELATIESELGSFTAEINRVELDLSTPEDALRSWWEAYRAGDLDSLIEASTQEVADVLREMRQFWEEEGILEQVLLDNFIRPYRTARMVVVQQGTFDDDLYVFEVRIELGDEIEESTIVVRREGNVWRVDSN